MQRDRTETSVGVWAQPGFRNLWLGLTTSEFGRQIARFALPLIAVLALDAAAEQVLASLTQLPYLLIALFAGVSSTGCRRAGYGRRRSDRRAPIARRRLLGDGRPFDGRMHQLPSVHVGEHVVGDRRPSPDHAHRSGSFEHHGGHVGIAADAGDA